MERYVAIDKAGLWPILTRLDEETIGALVFNQPCHGTWPGEVEAWISTDGGRCWKRQGAPVPAGEGEIRMNAAGGLGLNGEWLCAVAGYGGWTKSPHEVAGTHDYVLTYGDYWKGLTRIPNRVARSLDHGLTWETIGELPYENGQQFTPFGTIQQGEDGDLRMLAYGRESVEACAPHLLRNKILRSNDGGRSWQVQAVLPVVGANETASIHLGKGHWLAAVRTWEPTGSQQLVLCESLDDGNSWERGELVGIRDSFPAAFLQFNDKLLLFHGNRAPNNEGVDVRMYDPEYQGWTSPRRLVNFSEGDVGYPSATLNSRGEVVLAFYSSQVAHHQRYHMGVLIFNEEDFDQRQFSKI